TYPENTTYTTNVSELNYTFIEINCDSAWYSTNGGADNSSRAGCGTNFTDITSTEGSNTWTLYLNDSAGNENSSSVTFFKDTVIPLVSITTPENNTNTTNNQTEINYTVSDTNLNSCWWTNNSGSSNHSINCGTNITGMTWDEGLNTIVIYTNDTANNGNSSSITFRLDTTVPSLTIVHPTDGQSFAVNTTELNYTVSDSGVGLDSCWYRNNTDSVNISIECGTNTTISQGNDGTYTIYMWANDTLNNVASASASWTISTNAPAVSLNYPANNKWFNSGASIEFNFTAADSNGLSVCELWGNWTDAWHKNQTLTSVTSGAETNFSLLDLGEGFYGWNVWCNDTTGLAETSSWATLNRTFGVDTTFPQINLTYPLNTTYTTSPTALNYTFTETNPSSCWWNNGTTNSTAVTCGINWTGLTSNEGSNTWTVWINDSANNQNFSSVTFFVDSLSPTTNLLSPPNNTNVNNATITFSCNMTDAQISNITLYIWNSTGDLNYTNTTSLSGTFNSTNWTSVFSDGRYYWDCFGEDAFSNSAWNSQGNYTFLLDTITPVIALISPENNYVENTTTMINFTYNVTDTNSVNCSLILDGAVVSTNLSVNVSGGNNTFVSSASAGVHNWSINCIDFVGNTGNSSLWTLNVTTPSAENTVETIEEEQTPSSGGGNIISNLGELTGTGVSRVLYQNLGILFKFEENSHRLMLTKLTANSATIKVYSEPIEATFAVGEEKKFELNNDAYYDLYVKLNSIKNAFSANFTIKLIHESPAESNQENTAESNQESITGEATTREPQEIRQNFGFYFLIAISVTALIVLIIVIVSYISRKKTTRCPRYVPRRFC
ncbi:MAG: hypothetical protein KKE05_04425, partial [Nanoarchaeota archaeon]|nr:hypothetical protein [Nanoarchaeota archaeon]